MRFLLLNQFYPPDVAPTGVVLHDLARELVRRGHDVTAVCSRRSYDGGADFPPEQSLDGVRILRLAASGFGRRTFAGKAADYLSFAAGLATRLARLERPDLALALTTPPWIGLAIPKGVPHAHWIMDLYPDALAAAGVRATAPLKLLTRRELKNARLVLALGPHMARRARAYAPRVEHVPLWAPDGVSPRPFRRGDELVLMYSGNVGVGHLVDEFLQASLRAPKTRWIFAGGGKRMADVERFKAKHPEAPLEIRPYAPAGRLAEHLAGADVHLASLHPAWQGVMVPSKIMGIFAAGRAAIFVGGRDNEIAEWIESRGAGWVVAPGDVEGLLRAVEEARSEARVRGARAAEAARELFDRARNVGRVADLVEQAARQLTS